MDSSKKHFYPSQEYRVIGSLKEYCNLKPGSKYPVGIGDDAAVRCCEDNEELIFTCDALVENIDFSFSYMTPQEVGFKAMAANLSDCAAMGAIPESALVQITFPGKDKSECEERLIQIYKGFSDACRRWNYSIIGGDLSAGPCWTIGITMIGIKKEGARLLTRKGIKNGDTLWVCGNPGESAIGFDALQKWPRDEIPGEFIEYVEKHIKPVPQIELGILLSQDINVHAAMDLSDGIAKDCYTLCFDNDTSLCLETGETDIQSVFAGFQKSLNKKWYEWFLYGGEDYTLIFAALDSFDPSKYCGYPLHRIGKFTSGKNCISMEIDGKSVEVEKKGWDHFID